MEFIPEINFTLNIKYLTLNMKICFRTANLEKYANKVKFMISKKATKNYKIFTTDSTFTNVKCISTWDDLLMCGIVKISKYYVIFISNIKVQNWEAEAAAW